MMRIAIVGGKLQGMEAAYLAGKAGWQTVLIDKRLDVPAAGLCDQVVTADICSRDEVSEVLREVDLILPALENRAALSALQKMADTQALPLAFDATAYSLSSSKSASNNFFKNLGFHVPAPYPQCGFPILVKPNSRSGSSGVRVITSSSELRKTFGPKGLPDDWIAQKFLSGPSYSLEVIGTGGHYVTHQVTELHMDAIFDCKGVTAPARIPEELRLSFEHISRRMANALELTGIMDVEVIWHKGRLYILEIDARLPSQTPMAVYWSTGANMLESLAAVYCQETAALPGPDHCRSLWRPIRLEHIRVSENLLEIAGEHIMAQGGAMQVVENFFGAAEAITDFQPGRSGMVATLIHTGESPESLLAARLVTLENIRHHFGLARVIDSQPHIPEAVH